MDLNIIWFLIITFFVAVYAVLDGFDLGAGALHLFIRDPGERHLTIKAIGPVWHGNQVWLLAVGGTLFAAFPVVYATLLSSFYLTFILLLFALVFRAVSMKFREAVSSGRWQQLWDYAFGLGSILPPLLYGFIMGSIIQGLPIDDAGLIKGNSPAFLNLYSLLAALLVLSLFSMHGALYLILKTGGTFLERLKRHVSLSWMASSGFLLLTLFITPFISPVFHRDLLVSPLFWITSLLLMATLICIPVVMRRSEYFRAFLLSSMTIAALTGVTGVCLFPRLIPSSMDLSFSLTIYNAASTNRTLTVLLVIALLTIPVVIGYTLYIYKIFRGRVGTSGGGY